MATALRTVLVLLLSIGCALAQSVQITSASTTGPSSPVDVKARIDASGGTVTLDRIEFYDAAGKCVSTHQLGSDWSSTTTTAWTFSPPLTAVSCKIFYGRGGNDQSNSFSFTRPAR